MPSVTQIIHMRGHRRSLARRDPKGKVALGCSGLVSLFTALAAILIALSYTDLTRDLPSITTLPGLLDPPDGLLLQPTRLYDRSGEHVLLILQNPAAAEQQYLRFASHSPLTPNSIEGLFLPSSIITATLASADPGFWEHPGFTLTGILAGDHPTLAQRLASDLLLKDETPGLRRALRERLLGGQITSHFGREKVLEWYLNSANYGRLAYGVDAAARVYFANPGTELRLAEAALLAAVAQSPDLNPVSAPQAAIERQKRVIQDMLHFRMISPEEGIQAAQEELIFHQPEQERISREVIDLSQNIAPAFTHLVLKQLDTQISWGRLQRGGLHIITTLDMDLQLQTTCAVEAQLGRLQVSPVEGAAVNLEECQAARLLPALPFKITPPPPSLEANVVIIDPFIGQILALVGEPPVGAEDISLPVHAPGSLATPIIYLTAFTRGFSPASLVWDIPPETDETFIQNFDGKFHGPLRLRIAFANDYLVPAEQVLTQVGIENVLRTAQQLGILNPQSQANSSASSMSLFREMNLLEVSRVFGIFANQGILTGRALTSGGEPAKSSSGSSSPLSPLHPTTVLLVQDASGQKWLDWGKPQTRPILSPQLAYLITNVLGDEAARWPSLGHPNALEIGRPAAAKIGRTIEGGSLWSVGYTPQLVVGVWAGEGGGQVDAQPAASQILQEAIAGLWHAIIQYASREMPYQEWTVPAGLSNLQVCDPSGMLPTDDCPNIVDEVFLAGNEPVQADPLYRTLQINHESNRLATVFTSPDLVEERPYLIVPSEAETWAQGAGLAIPPEDYDIVPSNLPIWTSAGISSPAMFEVVRGQVKIIGKAGGDNFLFYRLQVGEGLNPQAWFLVGQDMYQPVDGGQLGVWDTSDLSGLFAIQLLVVRQDQSVERVTILVTVDNQAPDIQVQYPLQGAEIDITQAASIVLQADVLDNLGVKSVTIYLDNHLLGTLMQPPYAISWQAKTGTHTLRVVAADQAGNSSVISLLFSVVE